MPEKLFVVGDYWLTRVAGRPCYYIAWHDPARGGRRTKSTGCTDLDAVKQVILDHVLRVSTIRNAPPESLQLDVVWIRYWEEHAQHLLSAQPTRICLTKWQQWWTGLTVADVTLERQEAFVAWMRASGLGEGYVSRILAIGRASLNRAEKRGMIAAAPFIPDVQDAEARRQTPPKGRLLIMEEMGRLLDAAEADHHLMFLLLAIDTMSRPDAIRELTAFQVDHEAGLIHLNPPGRRQTKKYRPIVPITRTIRPWLMSERNGHYATYRGKPIGSIYKGWRILRRNAGLDAQVNAYSIRHTMGRELRRRRVPSDAISLMLGHTPVDVKRTDLIYSPYDPDFCRGAAEAIDDYCRALQEFTNRPISAPRNIEKSTTQAPQG